MSKQPVGGAMDQSQAPPFFCGSSSDSTCSSDLSDLTDPDRQLECSVERWQVTKPDSQAHMHGHGHGHGHRKNVPVSRPDNKWELVDREKALPHELFLQQKMEAELAQRKDDWLQECEKIKTDFFNLTKTGATSEGEAHHRGYINEAPAQNLDNRDVQVRNSNQSYSNQSRSHQSGSYDPDIRTDVYIGPSQRKGVSRTTHVHHPDIKNNNSKVETVSREIRTYSSDGQKGNTGVGLRSQGFIPTSSQQHSVSNYDKSGMQVSSSNRKMTTSTSHADMKNDNSYFSIKFDLREFQPHEINVVAEGMQIHIRAFHEDNRGDGYMCAKQFKKTVDIPDTVDPEKVVSYLAKNGMLKIKAPFEHDRVRKRLNDEFSSSGSADGNVTPTPLNDSIDEDSNPTSHNISMDDSMTAMSVSDNESVTPASPAHSAKGVQLSHSQQSQSTSFRHNAEDSTELPSRERVVKTTKVTTSRQSTIQNGDQADFADVASSDMNMGNVHVKTSRTSSKPTRDASISLMLGTSDESNIDHDVSGGDVESKVVRKSHKSSSRRVRDKSGGQGQKAAGTGARLIEITHTTSSREGTDSDGPNIEDIHAAPKGTQIPVMHTGSYERTAADNDTTRRTRETVTSKKVTSVMRNEDAQEEQTESEEDIPSNIHHTKSDRNTDKNIRETVTSHGIKTVNVTRKGAVTADINEADQGQKSTHVISSNGKTDSDFDASINGGGMVTSTKITSSSVKSSKNETVPISPQINSTEREVKISQKKTIRGRASSSDGISEPVIIAANDGIEQTTQRSSSNGPHINLECEIDPSNEANYEGEKIIVPSKFKYQSQAFHCEPSYKSTRTEIPYYHRTHYEYNKEPAWGRAHFSSGRQESLYGGEAFEQHNLNRSFELQHSPTYQEPSYSRSQYEYQQEPSYVRSHHEYRHDPSFISTNHEIEKGIYPRRSMTHHTSPKATTKGATFVYRSGGRPMDQTRYGSPPHSPVRGGSPPRYNAVSRFRRKSTEIPVSQVQSNNVNYEFTPLMVSTGDEGFGDPLSQMLPFLHTPLVKETKLGKVMDLSVNLGGRYEPDEVTVKVLGYKIYISAEHEDSTQGGRCFMREFNKDFMVSEELEGSTIRAKLEPNGRLTIGSSVKSNDDHEAVLKLILDSMPVGGTFLEVERTEKV